VKRWALRIFVFLLLGAIVNIAVAWGLAAWGSYRFIPEQFYSRDQKPRWLCSVDIGIGMTRTSFVPDNGNWGGETSPPDGFTVPYWSRARIPPSTETIEDSTMPWYNEHAYGWPMRSAIGELRNSKPTRAWLVIDGVEVLRSNSGSPMPFRVIPIRPIWPGFAINTLFYAAILWALFAVPAVLRRKRRIKRGLCAKCAYPLGESPVCTECGAAREARAGG
jgi:hypothetical protein